MGCIELDEFGTSEDGRDRRINRTFWGVQAMAVDGLMTIRRSHGPKDTMDRIEAAVKAKGLTVFARIDHAAGSAAVGLSLRPTRPRLEPNAAL
jgi:hypothetical protein